VLGQPDGYTGFQESRFSQKIPGDGGQVLVGRAADHGAAAFRQWGAGKIIKSK
jgi:hypothetical protein